MDRQTIAARIKALLQKTVENGATEAEAMAAAEKARELMDKYQIDMSEADVEAEGITVEFTAHSVLGNMRLKERMAVMVANYCDCKVWGGRHFVAGQPHRQGKGIHFMGLRSDAEFATWLLDSLSAFVRLQVSVYVITNNRHLFGAQRREAVKAFGLGCITRINQRLAELIDQRRTAMNGRALVVVKNQLVARAFANLGINIRHRKSSTTYSGAEHFEAGKAAGDHASFGRPVNGDAAIRQIGSR